jgi:hypothetical protein
MMLQLREANITLRFCCGVDNLNRGNLRAVVSYATEHDALGFGPIYVSLQQLQATQ